MLDPKNVVLLTCGVVSDPEMPTENILKLRVGADYAGSEKGSQNTSGYFDVTYYLNNDDNTRNAKFVKGQINDGKMKKGSQIQLQGRLVQERWSTDAGNRSKTVIVAEAITYAGGSRPAADSSSATQSEATAAPEAPPEF